MLSQPREGLLTSNDQRNIKLRTILNGVRVAFPLFTFLFSIRLPEQARNRGRRGHVLGNFAFRSLSPARPIFLNDS